MYKVITLAALFATSSAQNYNQYENHGQTGTQAQRFGENGSGEQQQQHGNGSYNTEQNWHHRHHGEFSDEEHSKMR